MMLLLLRLRVYGNEHVPQSGGTLVCGNHQSNFDPLVLGCAISRPMSYLAKKTLFNWAPLGWFLSWNDSMPIDRSGSGIGGMKETLRRLKRGEAVLMFPEGSRSFDGELLPVMRGFCTIARRTNAVIVPVGFDGTFHALPRGSWLPRLSEVHVVIGKPIDPETYGAIDDDAFAALLESQIAECFHRSREYRRRP